MAQAATISIQAIQAVGRALVASATGDKVAAVIEGVKALAYATARNGGHLVVIRATVDALSTLKSGKKAGLTAGTLKACAVNALKSIDSADRVNAGPSAGDEATRHALALAYAEAIGAALQSAIDAGAVARKAAREASKATPSDSSDTATPANEGAPSQGAPFGPPSLEEENARLLAMVEALTVERDALRAALEAAQATPAKRRKVA